MDAVGWALALHARVGEGLGLEVVLEEAGDGEEDAGEACGGEPVAFVGEDLGAVGYVEFREALVESVGVGGGDDVVGGAVEDEGWGAT